MERSIVHASCACRVTQHTHLRPAKLLTRPVPLSGMRSLPQRAVARAALPKGKAGAEAQGPQAKVREPTACRGPDVLICGAASQRPLRCCAGRAGGRGPLALL